MADLNSFAFTGRCTKDATVKTVNGKTLMEVDVANNIGYGDYAKTNWLKVKMWGDRCNNIVGIFKKGSLVTGQGELSTNEWTSNNTGEKHVDLVITVMNLQILASKKADGTTAADQPDESDAVF